MTGKTKADAIGTGGSVTKWLDCQVGAFNALLSHLKAGAIDCHRAARRAEEIARLTEWKLKHGELPIAEWRAEAVVIYCDLMAHVLTSETEKTKTRLLDMLEFNSAHSNAETVQLAPIGQLNTMIGIKSENVYGMGGTFKGELPEEWLSQTDGEPPAGDGSANAGRSQLKFRDLSDLSDKFKVHETPSDACGRQLSATSGNTSLGTGHKEPPAYKKGQNWIRQTVLNDIIFNATNRLATAKTKGFHADDNSWGVAQNKRTWRVERRAVFYYVPWLPRDEKDLVKKSQNPNRSRS